MEAVKDCLTGFCGDARTFVVDTDQHVITDPRNGDLDQAIGWREAHRVVEDRVERPGEPVGLAHDHGAVLARAGKGDACAAGLPARFPALHQLLDPAAEIDWSEMGPRKFGICPCGLTDIAEPSVHAGDIVAYDGGQPGPKLRILDPLEAVDRGAERGEGVLQLVAYV